VAAPLVLVPELASVLSAFGAAATDIRRERLRAVAMGLPGDPAVVARVASELAEEVRADLEADGIGADGVSVAFEADLRFVKQSFELAIPFTPPSGGAGDVDLAEALVGAFHAEYARRYGQGAITLHVPVELVAVRAIGTGRTVQARIVPGTTTTDALAEPVGVRRVRLGRDAGTEAEVPAYAGPAFERGHRVEGPALIDGSDTTVWVPPGGRARVGSCGTLVMEVAS